MECLHGMTAWDVYCDVMGCDVGVNEGKGKVPKPSYVDKGLDRKLLKHNQRHPRNDDEDMNHHTIPSGREQENSNNEEHKAKPGGQGGNTKSKTSKTGVREGGGEDEEQQDHVLRKQPKKVVFDAWHVAAGRFILAGRYS